MERALGVVAIFAAVLLGAATAPSLSEPQPELSRLMYSGHWTIQPPAKDGAVNFGLSYPATLSGNTDFVDLTRLGLTPESLRGANHTIEFQLKTEAGTFVCRGKVADGQGRGSFTFEPDAAYAKAYASVRAAPLAPRQQVQAGMFGVPIDFVDSVAAAGFAGAPFDTMLSMKIFGATPAFLQMLHADFPAVDPSDVVGTWMLADKQHVDLHALHVDFPTEDLDAIVALVMAGVTPAYVAALRTADVQGLSAEGIAVLRTHGIDQAFADRLAANGPRGQSVDQILKLKNAAP